MPKKQKPWEERFDRRWYSEDMYLAKIKSFISQEKEKSFKEGVEKVLGEIKNESGIGFPSSCCSIYFEDKLKSLIKKLKKKYLKEK